jgi:hypothetical protein
VSTIAWNPAPELDPELATLAAHLTAIAERGQPAYAAEAARLRSEALAHPHHAPTREAAAALVDAVLHDPYLTRFPAPRPSARS